MRVAICDDEKVFRELLREQLIAYKASRRVQMDISEFSTGDAFLKCNDLFDVVFLDYQMPELNGLETARKLRVKNTTCCIVFVTNFPHFMQQAFEVNTYRFFSKPITENDISKTLDDYIRQQKMLAPLIIVDHDGQKAIPSKDIIYLEGAGKYCIIKTATQKFISSKTLSAVLELLPQHCFFRIHKSFAVNLYCVDTVKSSEILLINGKSLPVSRNNYSKLKTVYRDFVSNFMVRT